MSHASRSIGGAILTHPRIVGPVLTPAREQPRDVYFNIPNVGETGFYVPFYSLPNGSAPPEPFGPIEGFVSQNRVVALMFSIFGLVATVIAGVGIYGVMSFSVSQRTQEPGVRMALGADTRRILRMVLIQRSRLAGLGAGLGVLLTLAVVAAAGDGIQSVLFGVSPRDPVIALRAE